MKEQWLVLMFQLNHIQQAIKSGAVTKIKNTGLKGYREFEKLLGSYTKQGNNWRKEAGKMYQSNKNTATSFKGLRKTCKLY